MLVSFLSVDEEKNKIGFQSEAVRNENEIIFLDKSIPNTKIKLSIFKNSFILERFGFVQMYMHFTLDKLTEGTYKTEEGLKFQFYVKTKSLVLQDNKIKVSYEMIMNEEVVSSLTFQVVFFQNGD